MDPQHAEGGEAQRFGSGDSNRCGPAGLGFGAQLERRRRPAPGLKCGNPAFLPFRSRVAELEKLASACAALTLAHSKTSALTSPRQASPRLPSGLTGLSSDMPVFQAFISLMNDCFDQDSAGVSSSAGTP